MKRKVTLTALFACVFALCLTAFAVTSAPQVRADGETYTLTMLNPLANGYDMAGSAETWTRYNAPVKNEDGGVTMRREEGASGPVNYAAGVGKYTVETGKTYTVKFSVKSTNVHFAFAIETPEWKTLVGAWANTGEYVDYELDYAPSKSGSGSVIFQLDGGNGDISVKDLRLYEKTQKTVTAGEAIGDLPAFTAVDGYDIGWKIDKTTVTAETVYNYGADKTAELVYTKLNKLTFEEKVRSSLTGSLEGWWSQSTGSAGITIENGVATIDFSAAGGTAYCNLTTVQGKSYAISVDYRMDDGTKTIGLYNTYSRWNPINRNITVTNEWQTYASTFVATSNNDRVTVQDGSSSATIQFRNIIITDISEKYFAGNETAIGELPEIPEKEGYIGYWAIDGEKITEETVYDFGADKTATIVYKKVNTVTLVSDSYDYDMASSAESWKHYNIPEINEEGGATLTRGADVASGTAVNYLAGVGKYSVSAGKTYVLSFGMKCDKIHMNIALDSPAWTILNSGWIENADYVNYKFVYNCNKDGQATIIFQIDAGSGNIFLKNLRFYEVIMDKTLTEDEAISGVPAIGKTAKHGYRWAWMAGETEIKNGDMLTETAVAKATEIALDPAHVISEVSALAATCDKAGYKKHYVCDTCGKYFLDAEGYEEIADIDAWKSGDGNVAATGHDLSLSKGVAATCTVDGYLDSYVCGTCGKIFADENAKYPIADIEAWKIGEGRIAAEGHRAAFVEGEAATCTSDGFKEYYQCTVCNACFEDEAATVAITDIANWKANGGKLAAKGHTPEENWTSDGEKHWHICSVCKEAITESEAAHTFDDGVITKRATCKEEGVKTFTCDVCEKTKTENIAKTDHTFDDGVITKRATCKEEGVKTYTCSVCNETKTETVAKAAHTETTEWVKDENNHWHVCSVCNEKLSEAAHGDANNDGKCDVCGAEIKGENPGESGSDKPGQSDESGKESGGSGESGNGGCFSGVSGAMAGTFALLMAAAIVICKFGRKE